MPALPYKIAVLCYLFNQQGHTLLLNRHRPPNQNLYSPIGGKLEMDLGESPTQCAKREIEEETGLVLPKADLRLNGIISEKAFNQDTHWLMFLFEVIKPVEVKAQTIGEGELCWINTEDIPNLSIPETDRTVIWPLFWRHRGQFFSAHIDCSGPKMTWELEQLIPGI